MLKQDSHDLHSDVVALRKSFSSLSQKLLHVAGELQNPGKPPSAKISEELAEARETFNRLQLRILALSPVAPGAQSAFPTNISEMETLVAQIAKAEEDKLEQTRLRALGILNRVQHLAYRDATEFPPLVACKTQANELAVLACERGKQLPPQILALVGNKHPLSALVTFIDHKDELDDEAWTALTETISEAFGPILSTAASRGKLVFLEDTNQGEVSSSSAVESTESMREPSEKKALESAIRPIGPSESDTSEQNLSDGQPSNASEPGSGHALPAVEQEAPTPVESSKDTSAVDSTETASRSVVDKGALSRSVGPSSSQLEDKSAPAATLPVAKRDHPRPEAKVQDDAVLPFHPKEASERTAQCILRNSDFENEGKIRRIIWELVFEGRLGLAMHLSRTVKDPRLSLPLSTLLRSAALSPHLRYGGGGIAHLLKDDFGTLSEQAELGIQQELRKPFAIMLVSAALRPSLLSPELGGSTILRTIRLGDGLDDLYKYSRTIADFGERLQGLDLTGLRTIKDHATWQTDLEALQKEVEAWTNQARQLTILYAPATKVWRKWQEPNGLIYNLLQPIKDNDADRAEQCKRLWERLADDAQIKREVEQTDRVVLKRRLGDDISSKALNVLKRHVREALDLAKRWLELQESSPRLDKGYLREQAEGLRRVIRERQQHVLNELDAFCSGNNELPMNAAILCCKRSIENIGQIFTSEERTFGEEPKPRQILNAELLKISHLPLDEEWNPIDSEQRLARLLIEHISRGTVRWQSAFDEHIKARDHEATARVIEFLELSGPPSVDIAELKRSRQKSLEECQAALLRDADDTLREVGNAVAQGLLREEEYLQKSAQIIKLQVDTASVLNFEKVHRELEVIREEIKSKRSEEIDAARKRLEALSLPPNNPAFSRIGHSLDQGDLLSANEYIEMVRNKAALPELANQINDFARFFPETLKGIEAFMEPPSQANRPDPLKMVKEIRSYSRGHFRSYSIGPVDMFHVAGVQAAQAADMLEAWFGLKKTQRVDDTNLSQVLGGFGLRSIETTVKRAGQHAWVQAKTEPIQDRNRCPVPIFGSTASGSYRILCTWDRPTEEDIVSEIGELQSGATFVFYFGRMSEQRRRDLARLSRERRRTFVLVDDLLVLYLCGERGSRLPVLFDCTLPFTFLEPYTTTAGLVPPEMFYGRERERSSIIDPMGTCFIYGGRQLGKTALLRDVERTVHSIERGTIALWIDLKAEGIGYDRPIDGIWDLLARELKNSTLLPTSLPAHTSPDKIFALVGDWLEKDPARRVLLLLDEADRFLESDGKEDFVRSARIKGLMDRTNRRFKVVFAGLHNVQRTTRASNHPLAHYGEPISIGPLLNDGEWHEARALIERPLASLGYRFESPDLVTRILSQTNYYPSLIQLYCKQLLAHVTDHRRNFFDYRASPPYVITSSHVEDAYQSQSLRTDIRNRFMWTLDLDPRYRLIAFWIALSSLSNIDKADSGFPAISIRDDVVGWWAQGFHETSSEDSFRVLLDEMTGLGVLRVVEAGRYALRSPNVLSLIGTQDEIVREIESFCEREAPAEYEAGSFRAAYREAGRRDPVRRSPLTAQQESDLRSRENKVAVIIGSEATGLRELCFFLEYAFGKEFFFSMEDVLDGATFAKRLAGIDFHRREGTSIVVIPHTCPWSEVWIESAIQKINKLKSRTSFVRILFVADPRTAWQLIRDGVVGPEHPLMKELRIVTLNPWHDAALKQWLEDCGFEVDKEGRMKITSATGNWPFMLMRFYELAKSDPAHWEQCLNELSKSVQDPTAATECAARLGLAQKRHRQVLHDLATLGEATVSDLDGIHEDVPTETLTHILRLADWLSLIRRSKDDMWQVDPFVGYILTLIGD